MNAYFLVSGWYCAMTKENELEKGGMLLELLVALPMILLLMASLWAAFASFMKEYTLIAKEWELQQELRSCMERMVQDAKLAEDICINSSEEPSLGFTRRTAQGEILRGCYMFYPGVPGSIKKMKEERYGSPQPMTSGSRPGRVSITKVSYEIRDQQVFISLWGKDLDSSLEAELSTAVALPVTRKGEGNEILSR